MVMRPPAVVDDATVVGAVTVDDIRWWLRHRPAVRHLTNRAEDSPGRDQGPLQRPPLRLIITGKPSRQCRCIEFGEGSIPDDE